MENQCQANLQPRKDSRLLLFPVPLKGHTNPMFDLGEILHSKGFSVTIIHTKFNAPKSENYPNFKFHFLSDGPSDDELSTADILAFVSDLNTKYVGSCRSALSQLLANPVEGPIACLISDAILHFTRAVADSFELPRIVLRTGGISSFHAFASYPLLQEKGYLPIQDSRLEEPILELPPLRFKDLPVINGCNQAAICELLKIIVQETKASSGVIWNSFEELEEPALITLQNMLRIPIFPIGPFHKCCPATSSSLMTPDKDCISWLDKQKLSSVIYVSFGSLASMNENIFLEIAWALANSNHPFLWVVRPHQIHSSEWLESLPSDFLDTINGRGYIVKWAPQLEVLAHPAVGAFWTHNGWNSTLESICEGVPMICMPFFTDQLANARYVTHVWKVGLPVDKEWHGKKIRSVINTLMEEKEGQNIRIRMSKLKQKAELCLRPGGSSYESLKRLESYISSL